jgi:hypothetical protein
MKLYILKDKKDHIQSYSEIQSEGMIEIEVENIPEDFDVNFFAYKFSNNKLIFDSNYHKSILDIHNIQFEKDELLKWLFDNDWKVNKIIVGEWNIEDPRWIDYKNERQIKRKRLDEINTLLN